MGHTYSNENFPHPAVQRLRELGQDVVSTHDAGEDKQAIFGDEALEYATTE